MGCAVILPKASEEMIVFTFFGKPYRHCDGITRRHFLTAGVLGLGGLTLADILRAEADAARR
jgi:hypothetical protein